MCGLGGATMGLGGATLGEGWGWAEPRWRRGWALPLGFFAGKRGVHGAHLAGPDMGGCGLEKPSAEPPFPPGLRAWALWRWSPAGPGGPLCSRDRQLARSVGPTPAPSAP